MNLTSKDLWILDVDNTLVRDVEHPEPFADALTLWKTLRDKGRVLTVMTNVGRLSARQVHTVVTKAGFDVELPHTFTAGAAAAAYIHNRAPGARCFVISEGGALEDFIARGLNITNNPPVEYVAVGADRGMTFEQLNFATKMVRDGAELICISGSRDYPGIYLGHENVFIGERSIVAAIEDATGKKPVIVGKPLPEILIEIVKTLGYKTSDAVMVGDNPGSDVAGGKAAGITTLLVKRPDNIIAYNSMGLDEKPDIEVDSLEDVIRLL